MSSEPEDEAASGDAAQRESAETVSQRRSDPVIELRASLPPDVEEGAAGPEAEGALSHAGLEPVEPWEATGELHRGDYRVFQVNEIFFRSPRSRITHNFFVLQCPAWVNVVPVTADGRVVLVRQFRYGVRKLTLEVPGGMVDAGERPDVAASRELLEETGYASDPLIPIGRVSPNPAIQNNYCYSYIAPNARYVQAPNTDSTEEIQVVLVPKADLARLVVEEEIEHSLVVVAIYALELYERGMRWTSDEAG